MTFLLAVPRKKCLTITEQFFAHNWCRDMVVESTDHGNDVSITFSVIVKNKVRFCAPANLIAIVGQLF